jgi:hypothetical protein
MADIIGVETFGREEFITERFDYQPGQHVTILAPTQNGKTTFTMDLLDQVTTPRCPATVLVMKPGDRVISRAAKKYEFPIVRDWPPSVAQLAAHPHSRARILWPKYLHADPELDYPRISAILRKGILHNWKKGQKPKGQNIIVADEHANLREFLGLGGPLDFVLATGGGMDVGMWNASQRPAHVSQLAYNGADHLFLGRETDKRSRDRFAEIGGVDPDIIKYYVARLPKFGWFYINRDGPVMCQILP